MIESLSHLTLEELAHRLWLEGHPLARTIDECSALDRENYDQQNSIAFLEERVQDLEAQVEDLNYELKEANNE